VIWNSGEPEGFRVRQTNEGGGTQIIIMPEIASDCDLLIAKNIFYLACIV